MRRGGSDYGDDFHMSTSSNSDNGVSGAATAYYYNPNAAVMPVGGSSNNSQSGGGGGLVYGAASPASLTPSASATSQQLQRQLPPMHPSTPYHQQQHQHASYGGGGGGSTQQGGGLSSTPLSSSSLAFEDEDLSPPADHFDTSMQSGQFPSSAQHGDSNDNFKVVIRVRPPVTRELEGPRPFVNVVRIPTDHRTITLCEHLDMSAGTPLGNNAANDPNAGGAGSAVYSTQSFTFDYVYDAPTKQRDVYERSAQPAVLSVLQGYNATVIAYGQTGTGKTTTMEGFSSMILTGTPASPAAANAAADQRGIIPRAIEEIFSHIASCRNRGDMRFLVRASYLQIYNEVISDLLKPLGKQLSVRHTKQRGVYIDGLSEWVVRSPNDVYGLMERGRSLRATGSTRLSELSSRSHAMFIIIVEVMEGQEENPTSYKFGKLNIVDLAGSEKVRQTGVTGQRLDETKFINWSLHELGNVISALTARKKDKHIPFRNSCLTSALRDSLGGNCKTTLIACISPALESYSESLSTLKFANRAKNIKNEATINEDVDQGTLLRRYEKELKRLRQLLQQQQGGGGASTSITSSSIGISGGVGTGGNGGGGGDFISQLEMGKRRAEEDREAALEALQESSRAHHEELITRKRLEGRILELESIVSGGHAGGMLGPSGVIESGLTAEDYAMRLDELDKERQVVEEDKAQVERYKQLLLKQRDIMLNLTTRLNERDETILQLQEEIDAYDAHIQMLEDAMEANNNASNSNSNQTESPLGDYFHSVAEAQQHIRELAVNGGGAVKYRSESNPDGRLLSAEEKMVELLMLSHRPAASSSTGAAVGGDAEYKQRVSDMILRERVDVIAQRISAEKVHMVQRDTDLLRAKLLASDDKRRSLEYLLEMAKQQQHGGSSASASSAQLQQQQQQTAFRKYLEQEQEAMRQSYTSRIQALQQELDQEREQRRRLARDVDRFRFDVGQMRSLVDSNKRFEMERLWKGLEQVEAALFRDLLSGNGGSPSSSAPPSPAIGPRDASSTAAVEQLRQQTKQLELQNEALKKQNATQQTEFISQLRERDAVVKRLEDELNRSQAISSAQQVGGGATAPPSVAEFQALQKNLQTHIKDRRALKTILESRIKVKVDTIGELQLQTSTQQSGGGSSAAERHQRLAAEIRALQNLVNASIAAMESS